MRLTTLILAIFFLLSLQVLSQTTNKIQTLVLDNGLTVILNEDHSRSEVFGTVVCRAGAKNDPHDATGMAHYQEHMLFKGTTQLGTTDWEKEKIHIDEIFKLYDELGNTKDEQKRAEIQQKINQASLEANKYAIPNETSNLIKSLGGTNLNAGTGWDMTLYYNSFPPNQIERWLELYSHRFKEPVFRGFQSELEVVYEEKNMYSDKFFFNILEVFTKNFFKKHPYGQHTLVGTVDDLKNPSLTKMYKFYKTYYVANNMALILVGDFDTETVLPMIKEKFGILEKGEIPENPIYNEESFKGRELVEIKSSPIKMAFLGFRTVPKNHPDELKLDIANYILNNENSTGLLDQLSSDNKLLASNVFPYVMQDHGAAVLIIIPKIIGQSHEAAEKLVLEQIEKLKNGEFEDWMIEAAKNQLYVRFQQSLENFESKSSIFAEAFAQKLDINDLLEYPEKVKKITKEDVVNAAKTYYGENYLALFSSMGSLKPEKISKPDYKPVISNTDAKSSFAKKLESIKTSDYEIKVVDFDKDITTSILGNNKKLYFVENKVNDIFSLEIRFGIGELKLPLLPYSSTIMNYAGTKELSMLQVKQEFNKIGCVYSFSSDESYLTISLKGLEQNLEQSIKLLNSIITNPVIESAKLKILIEGTQAERKMEDADADNIADALYDYLNYKDKSSYIDRLTIGEIKKLTTNQLIEEFNKAIQYEVEIHYVGNSEKFNSQQVREIINQNLTLPENVMKSESPTYKNTIEYNQNAIYYVNKKDASQSKIFIFANGAPYTTENRAYVDAFNLYFGGDFSGLVLQEIREYRSMAYTAGANFSSAVKSGQPTKFTGYIGTQADKTNDAIDIFMGLVRNMPQKTDRIDMIKNYLSYSAITTSPNFRNLSKTVTIWKNLGYNTDPKTIKLPVYNDMKFDDIVKFYNSNIKDKPYVIAIVGNMKNINLKELEKYGKVTQIKQKVLYKK